MDTLIALSLLGLEATDSTLQKSMGHDINMERLVSRCHNMFLYIFGLVNMS